MSPLIIIGIVFGYFLVLLGIAFYTARGATNESFFIGKKNSKWYLVAYGMIGTSLSGVTFMSVPGGVEKGHFAYMQIVIGYLLGSFVIAFVLLPLYYRLNLTSIYSYLKTRFGNVSYKTGATFFLVSRTLGASIRIFLVLNVLQIFMLDAWHIPFPVTVFVVLLMILLYTFKGGVKTIVWTDTLQTTFMVLALVVTVFIIQSELHLSFGSLYQSLQDKGYTQVFNTDWRSTGFFVKQILSGMFITITMTGLDQEMMQKNISVKTLGESQKNMIIFSFILLLVNALFLFLGGILYLFMTAKNIAIPLHPDDVFPTVALQYLPPITGLVFVIGLVSALFPSADGALTALTSSFCIDILDLKERSDLDEEGKMKVRRKVHLSVAFVFLLAIVFFRVLNEGSVITAVLKIAGYTYGPLLGLFVFGLFTKQKVNDSLVPAVCILSPILSFLLDHFSTTVFFGYQMGFEVLLVNGFITFIGLYLISSPDTDRKQIISVN
ncbi:MAG: sodium:solute symporter [Bacteroidota bacterium]|nr:sodium:solute symporter [Bacteroidota bacterium]